jgi:hypothetical protein
MLSPRISENVTWEGVMGRRARLPLHQNQQLQLQLREDEMISPIIWLENLLEVLFRAIPALHLS